MSWVEGTRTRLRLLFARRAGESRMDDEMRFHIEMETERLVREAGLDPREARRRALATFGGVEKHKETLRDGRGLAWLSGIPLDLKLGLRMLVKYPGLSLVAVIGQALAIALGAGWFGALDSMLDPSLPLAEDERVISIRNRDAGTRTRMDDMMDFAAANPDRQSLHDYFLWRDELKSVRDLGAFRTVSRNLLAGGTPELVQVAEMTASGFRVARVAPVLGRPLVNDDERAGAPPVVVIAYEDWQRRFAGDPLVVGRPVRLGTTMHTVVGVMPEGFRFPVNHHFWVPVRLNPLDYERGNAPAVNVFGRLKDGTTLSRAQAEMATVGRRMAAAFPESHAHLEPRVTRYTYAFHNLDGGTKPPEFYLVQNIYVLLLILICVNVAVLVYSRTATRLGEVAVRTALGASRRRIVTQLFAEALVLSLLAAAIGLTLAGAGLGIVNDMWKTLGDEPPFWLELRLSPAVVVYVVGLAVFAGAIVGILPALKAIDRRVQAELQLFASRGQGMQLGRLWTTMIVAQVAIAVAVLPPAIYHAAQSIQDGSRDPGYPADEFLRARLSTEGQIATGEDSARFIARAEDLLRRLTAEPAVIGVTFATRFPGNGEPGIQIEVEAAAGGASYWAQSSQVATDLFTVFDVPLLSGRAFAAGDASERSTAVIVNRVLAQDIDSGGNVLGRRVRQVVRNAKAGPREVEAGPWLEIVGVVPNFPTMPYNTPATPTLYRPVTLGQTASITLAVRTRTSPAAMFAGKLREITASVDPDLQLHELQAVAETRRFQRETYRYTALGIVAVMASVLLLSAAGIYAMMAFTVTRRRREIGIRIALGADARHVLSGIFARACAQLGLGVGAGLVVSAVLDGGEYLGGTAVILLPAVAALMMGVGLLAALGPARRGLAVQPSEALRAE